MLAIVPGKPRVLQRRKQGTFCGARKKKWNETSRRQYTPREKELAIRLRFGSLTQKSGFCRTLSQISKLLGWPKQSIYTITHAHQLSESDVLNPEHTLNKRSNRPTLLDKIPGEVLRELVSKRLLTEWMFIPLSGRCELIRRRWNIEMNRDGLRNIYLSQGISFTKPKTVTATSLKKHAYWEKQRFIFACRHM